MDKNNNDNTPPKEIPTRKDPIDPQPLKDPEVDDTGVITPEKKAPVIKIPM